MKAFVAFLLMIAFSAPAFATTDAITSVWLVVQNVQDDTDFTVKSAPVIGCYGVAYGPQLEQFTAEYKVPGNIGCGGFPAYTENINALSCAKLVEAKESDDYMGFKAITLDISKCAAKENSKFITMIRTAAKRNFPLKKGEVALTLLK